MFGVFGVEGWKALIGYPLSQGALTLLLLAKTGGSLADYFGTWQTGALGLATSGLMTYVFFWVVCHNLVHLY